MYDKIARTLRMSLPALLTGAALVGPPAFAGPCEALADLTLPTTTITAAQVVAAGTFRPPEPAGTVPADELRSFDALPAFCRVEGVIAPSSDSHIRFEVWLPLRAWNGRYWGVGNGGYGGSITYSGLVAAVRYGYAVSSTDTGHEGSSPRWALGHAQKLIDYGYRAIHETAEKSKAVIRAFYLRAAKYSYFDSCSNGGRQGLMEAQRYPGDYDGVIAGDPAAFLTHLRAESEWIRQATEKDPASYIPASKYPAIKAAVLAGCDARDGLEDGLIDDPRKCDFKPSVLLCHGPESASCLTAPQITALKKIYAGPRDSQGRQIYPGLEPGGETGANGWGTWISGSAPGRATIDALDRGWAYLLQNPTWDLRTANLEHDVNDYDAALSRVVNAIDPNLRAFRARGGKLMLYNGWNDPDVSPLATIQYYDSVVRRMGLAEAESFTRLYMVPGMQHCSGGPGPNTFTARMVIALQDWVEKGVAPRAVIATKFRTDGDPASGVMRTRPLCPYPQVARYKGARSIDDASNFVCRAP